MGIREHEAEQISHAEHKDRKYRDSPKAWQWLRIRLNTPFGYLKCAFPFWYFVLCEHTNHTMYAKKCHSFRKGTSVWKDCQIHRYKGHKTLKYKRKRETISVLTQEVVLTLLFNALKVHFTGHTFNFPLIFSGKVCTVFYFHWKNYIQVLQMIFLSASWPK